MGSRRSFLVLPLVALLIGFAFSSQRAREPQDGVEQEQLAALGLPPQLEYTALLVTAGDPARLYLGTDDGIFTLREPGGSWRLSGLANRRVDALAEVGGSVYASAGGRVWRLAETWVADESRPKPLALGHQRDPNNPARLLDPGAALRLSRDGGKTWRTVLTASGGVGAAAWSPAEPGVAYAAAGDGQLYRSGDGGETWLVAG